MDYLVIILFPRIWLEKGTVFDKTACMSNKFFLNFESKSLISQNVNLTFWVKVYQQINLLFIYLQGHSFKNTAFGKNK